MLVSWNWLKDYVALPMPHDELVARLSMAGLNHEESRSLSGDTVIDLEVTSNRPDCLGHVGVAREIAVLFQQPLQVPDPQPPETDPPVSERTRVPIQCPELCSRYTARVIQGVRIGPSPAWLAERLQAVGIAAINNVVDVTNYVMMECGQPLHAFDFAQLLGREIIVRQAQAGEQFAAINHKLYDLEPGMCVIADAERPVALGGVMGGADTEVAESTTDVLIEAADFAPISIRTTARKLVLHSPSSYRFERGVDPLGIDWASRRCCELILQTAGGRLARGVVAVGAAAAPRAPIVLRLSQLPRVLGITITADDVRRILTALGCAETAADQRTVTVVPPTWRRDLTREIDLVEEVARVHGYDRIPEDVGVPMAPSHRSDSDRVLAKVRHVLTAAGFDEAMTVSVVPQSLSEVFSPWTSAAPLRAHTPMLKGADHLRRSLIPSLLEARRINESLANPVVELFETAWVYLPQAGQLPAEQWTLGIASGGGYYHLKGVAEALAAALNPALRLEVADTHQPLLDPAKSCQLQIAGRVVGYLGEISAEGLRQAGLRNAAAVAELNLDALARLAQLIPQHVEQSPYPAIDRDLNLVVAEGVRWNVLAETVRQAVGDTLEMLRYQETYRDSKRDGAGKKRLLFSITLRSSQRTLTNEEADQIRQAVVAACQRQHAAVLLGT
jgi:phenylalanyl-tRNA synthetase beta chain